MAAFYATLPTTVLFSVTVFQYVRKSGHQVLANVTSIINKGGEVMLTDQYCNVNMLVSL